MAYILVGVSPVENIKWHSESDLLSWSPPFFYSKESSDAFVYVVQLDGFNIFNTTSTNVYLNVSSSTEFNVSITVHIQISTFQEKIAKQVTTLEVSLKCNN